MNEHCCKSCGLGLECESECAASSASTSASTSTSTSTSTSASTSASTSTPAVAVRDGYDNCTPFSGELAPCQRAKVERGQRRRTRSVPLFQLTVSAAAALELPTEDGEVWYAGVLPSVGLAGLIQIRQPKVSGFSAHLGVIGLSKVLLAQDPEGPYVRVVDVVDTVAEADIQTGDGKCGTCDDITDWALAGSASGGPDDYPALVFVGRPATATATNPTVELQVRRYLAATRVSGVHLVCEDGKGEAGRVAMVRKPCCPPGLRCGRPVWSPELFDGTTNPWDDGGAP